MVFEKIQEIIAERTDISAEEITLETNLREDLDADSLDLFQVLTDIEDEYGIDFDSPADMVTVGDLVDYVE
ncbi:MAG: acyl carrier protein, partial [Lachnospiraceae bacterium]|nr:acyl carrier protein [Lachnospiraceae bacterium]